MLSAQKIQLSNYLLDALSRVAEGVGKPLPGLDLAAIGDSLEKPRQAEHGDIATNIAQLQQTMTVLQATQASFTKLTSVSLFDYLK